MDRSPAEAVLTIAMGTRGAAGLGHAVAALALATACAGGDPRGDSSAAGAAAATGGTGAGASGASAGSNATGGMGAGAGGGGAGSTPAADGGTPTPTPDAGATEADAGAGPDEVWSRLTVMAVTDPIDHGAVGDGVADDLGALAAAIDALPEAGGIVYLPAGASFKKTDLLVIDRPHVKLWSPDRQAEIFQSVAGERRRQSLLCRQQEGCGFFGLKLRSDASERFDALEDNQISADHGSLIEIVGCEIDGSAATGVFLYGSTQHYVQGNYIHHTWADHVHHTEGARDSWVWDNFVLNEAPSDGDDGVACVTYGPDSPRCGDMEWWGNVILGTGWGRGYSVIGGEGISIHDNWAIGVAGAGIIVASESSYDSASSHDVEISRNYVYRCAHAIGHPGILISGASAAAGPLEAIALRDNVCAETVTGEAWRVEGETADVTNEGLVSEASALPTPIPTVADVRFADTSVLRTRDVSHAPAAHRAGLHRIHVRQVPGGGGFEQRFEYVVKGAPAAISALVADRTAQGDHVSAERVVAGAAYARLLAAATFPLPAGVAGVTFRELREGDRSGQLDWLFGLLDVD